MKFPLKNIYERIMRADVLVTCAFFVLLFCGLFLGDGKQGVIEVFSGSIVFVCWGLFYMKNGLPRRLPSFLYLGWIIFSAAAYISLLRSDSIGFSLSWFIRFFSSYALYLLFYSIASKTTIKAYVIGSCALAIGATGISLLSASFQFVRELLPSMNLVDIRYGHSHLADVLVFVCPAILYWVYSSGATTQKKLFVGVLCLTALFFTFARGAWIVVGLYVAWYVGAALMKRKKPPAALSMLLLFVLLCVVVGMSQLSYIPHTISNQLMRPATISSRLEYWRQATEALKERPLFGSGPGTFSLESQRFQKTTSQSSWFAHSIIMQTLAEAGVVGLSAFLWLISIHFLPLFRKAHALKDRSFMMIIHGCALLFAYGLFEFVLDYQVLWLLFWGGIGLVSGMVFPSTENRERNQPLFTLSLWYIATFYFLWMCSAFASVFGVQAYAVYLLAPHDAGNALMALTKTKNTSELGLINNVAQFFHAKNPYILVEIAKTQRRLHLDADARRSIKSAAFSYPIMEEVQKEYVLSLILNKDYAGIAQWIRTISPRLFYSDAQYSAQDLTLSQESIEHTVQRLPSLFDNTTSPNVRYSRYFYALGLYYLSIDTEKTARLWRLANALQPNLSYLWIERAVLERYVSMDIGASNDILRECQKNTIARSHCTWALYNQERLRPGGYEKQIYEE